MESQTLGKVRASRAGGGWFRKRKYRLMSYVFPKTLLLRAPVKPYHRTIASLLHGSFVDLGCGVGSCSAMYSVLTRNRAVGMDLKVKSLAYAAREAKRFRIPATFVSGSVLATPFPDDSFDSAYLGQVIEHIHEDQEVVREAYRILRPEGRLVISVPKGRKCMSDEHADDGHVNFYHVEEDCTRLFDGLPMENIQFHEGDKSRWIFSGFLSRDKIPMESLAPLGAGK